jgi:hypothetical protein
VQRRNDGRQAHRGVPFLGWGAFGAAITPIIAVATLVLHLVYGATFGWLMDRG